MVGRGAVQSGLFIVNLGEGFLLSSDSVGDVNSDSEIGVDCPLAEGVKNGVVGGVEFGVDVSVDGTERKFLTEIGSGFTDKLGFLGVISLGKDADLISGGGEKEGLTIIHHNFIS